MFSKDQGQGRARNRASFVEHKNNSFTFKILVPEICTTRTCDEKKQLQGVKVGGILGKGPVSIGFGLELFDAFGTSQSDAMFKVTRNFQQGGGSGRSEEEKEKN
eukprot:750072-Hanusia_phi.AAC.4